MRAKNSIQERNGVPRKKIAIACQGGGSHTAFTAGVLKTFLHKLDPDRYHIVGLSGTSGGAMCALLAWYGLLVNDPAKGSALLDRFWKEIAVTGSWDIFGNAWLVWINRFRNGLAFPEISPYDLPTPGQDRLTTILEGLIPFADLDRLIGPTTPTLMVGAVNVGTGEFTVFEERHRDKNRRISVEALLASAALPALFQAVHIGKDCYWDGLFSQNPPIRGFLSHKNDADLKPDEIWIIQINPEARNTEPRSVNEIADRRNELAGNLSLNQEVSFIVEVNDWLRRGWLNGPHFKHVEIRRIALDLDLDEASKLDRRPGLLQRLVKYGESQGVAFLHNLQMGSGG
jgi:NTE family protein